MFNPEETADNLRKYGGYVPGIRPGKSTADYLDFVLTRLTVLGAAYLAAVCFAGNLMSICCTILFWRHVTVDCCDSNLGYSEPDPISFACASI